MTNRDPAIFIALMLGVAAIIMAKRASRVKKFSSSNQNPKAINDLVQELAIKVGDLSAKANSTNAELEKQVTYLTKQLKKLEKGAAGHSEFQFDTTDLLEERIKKLEEDLAKRNTGKLDFDLELDESPTPQFAFESGKHSTETPIDILRTGLAKTQKTLFGAVQTALDQPPALLTDINKSIHDALTGSGMDEDLATKLSSGISTNGENGSSHSLAKIQADLNKALIQALAQRGYSAIGAEQVDGNPKVILVSGTDASGKTSVAGRLAFAFSQTGAKVLLGATAPYAPVLAREISAWAQRSGISLVLGSDNTKPTAVAYKSIHRAQDEGCQIVILDVSPGDEKPKSAGQLIAEIVKMVGREQLYAPHEILLTVNATNTAESLTLLKETKGKVNFTGVCFAKLDLIEDVTSVIKFAQEIELPIRYVSVGSGEQHLIAATPENLASSLFPALRVSSAETPSDTLECV